MQVDGRHQSLQQLQAGWRALSRVDLRLRLQDGGEEVAVPVLILAPVLKVLEQGVQLVVGVALQVPVDADVPPVPDLQTRRSATCR